MAEDKLENESTEADIVAVEEAVVEAAEKAEEVAEVPVAEEVTVEEAIVEEPKTTKKPTKSKKAVENAITSETVEEKETEDIDALLDKLIAEEENAGNIIGSLSADKVTPVAVDADATKVAVYSSRNASWGGYGSVYKGYNILSKRRADAWLTRGHVRLATPAEVAQHLR